jgi:hypothetical protein
MTNINKRRRPIAAVLGFLILVFTVVGIISTIVGAVKLTASLIDNTAQKREFERIIYPVLMFDPVPFDKIEAADENLLLNASMWAVLLNTDEESFDTNEIGFMLIPSIDLDVWCKKMFGPSVSLSHRTIEGEGYSFYYDEATKEYQVPDGTQISHYTPSVESVSKKGDVYTLKVNYISPSAITETLFTGEDPVADKVMTYTLTKTEGKYLITSIGYATEENIGDVSWEPIVSVDTSSETSDEVSSEVEVSSDISSDTSSEQDTVE